MYFQNFPQFLYDYDINGDRKVFLVSDITRNIRFRRDILANISVYDEYDIVDGETPEIIAEKYYGNAQYHWIVMLANNIHDVRSEWPMSTYQFELYMEDKYGDSKYAVHHYENANGHIVNSSEPFAAPISNMDYEQRINESKRRIKLVSPEIISTVLKNFRELI